MSEVGGVQGLCPVSVTAVEGKSDEGWTVDNTLDSRQSGKGKGAESQSGLFLLLLFPSMYFGLRNLNNNASRLFRHRYRGNTNTRKEKKDNR